MDGYGGESAGDLVDRYGGESTGDLVDGYGGESACGPAVGRSRQNIWFC